ncbi:hypothetical protein SLEP1_g52358 [Rubroshorea leprosula]|uniref:TmcB/TmcC TPR repeats domain-containing protein n=1 Tax=Rubroshorea leprosula TaxID=152421 RepID=A0AAV5M8B2_9ROSI|nr:hypothetical protein SLEP1_g52358 [Rubroshorea leprosula]
MVSSSPSWRPEFEYEKQREAVEAGDFVEDKNVVVEALNGDESVTSKSKWNFQQIIVNGISSSPSWRPEFEYEVKSSRSDFGVVEQSVVVFKQKQREAVEVGDFVEDKNVVVEALNGDELVTSKSEWNLLSRMNSSEIPVEILLPVENLWFLPSSATGNLSIKPVQKWRLESTGEVITEKKAMPLSRHLKKSETFKDTREDQMNVDPLAEPSPVVKKSKTFKDRTNFQLSPAQNNSPALLGSLKVHLSSHDIGVFFGEKNSSSSKNSLHLETNGRRDHVLIRRAMLKETDVFQPESTGRSRCSKSEIPEEEHVADVEGDDFLSLMSTAGDWPSYAPIRPDYRIPIKEFGFSGNRIGRSGNDQGKPSDNCGDDGFGDRSKIGNYYKEMLTLNPDHSLLLRNYGKYLHEVENDVEKAEEYYGRAILASPSDGEVLSLYGKLIWETQKDEDRAKVIFDSSSFSFSINFGVFIQ